VIEDDGADFKNDVECERDEVDWEDKSAESDMKASEGGRRPEDVEEDEAERKAGGRAESKCHAYCEALKAGQRRWKACVTNTHTHREE
jgi:hypothetical protein